MQCKKCCRCGLEQPFDNFCVDRREADGLARTCKTCRREICHRYRHSQKGAAQRRRMEATEDWRRRHSAAVQKYRQSDKARQTELKWWASPQYKASTAARRRRPENKIKKREAIKRYNKRHPERYLARQAVNALVKCGVFAKPANCACVHCGQPARHYHHYAGYGPEHAIDVIPLCIACHEKADHAAASQSNATDGSHLTQAQ